MLPKRFSPHSFYPDDIFHQEYTLNMVVSSYDLLYMVKRLYPTFVKDYGLHYDESLSFVNWIVRRIFVDRGFHVSDYFQHDRYDSAYRDHLEEEKYSLLYTVLNTLEKRKFKATTMQCFCTKEGIFFSFGAGYVNPS